MAFKVNNKQAHTDDGIPFLWGSGDYTSAPSFITRITRNGAQNDFFGDTVAIGHSTIFVGVPYFDQGVLGDAGKVEIYDLNGIYQNVSKLAYDGAAVADIFGYSISTGSCGLMVGMPFDDDNGSSSGSAYLFGSTISSPYAKVKPSDGAAGDRFGSSVAIGSSKIVVGAHRDADNGTNSGSAYIFNDFTTYTVTQQSKIKPSDGAANDEFGFSIGVKNGLIIVGSPYDDDNGSDSGSAYLFNISGTQLAKIKASDGASNDLFGYSVAIGSGRIVIGAPYNNNRGSVYVYNYSGTLLRKISAYNSGVSNQLFGSDVAVGDGLILIGAPGYNSGGISGGIAYVYDLNCNYITNLTPSSGSTSLNDRFGDSVALSTGSGRIVVGAPYEDNTNTNSGAAYIWSTSARYNVYDIAEMNSYGA